MDKLYKPNHPTTLPTGKYFSALVLFFASLLFLSSCGQSPSDELGNKISIASRDKNVDEKDWNNLISFIDSNQVSFSDLLDNNKKVDAAKLKAEILEVSSHRRNSDALTIFDPKSIVANAIKPTVKVFIENSVSMDGYVNGNTEFKTDLTEMLVGAKKAVDEKNVQINFINSGIIESSNTDIPKFADKLEPHSINYDVGGRGRLTSDINNIFRMILDSLNNEQIVILISDCIYSLNKGNGTVGKLGIQKSLTHDAFNDAMKSINLETVCLKMNSTFKGNYFDLNDHPTYIEATRPYYIWIVGEKHLLENYYPSFTKDMTGIERTFTLSDFSSDSKSSSESHQFYTVLKETNRVGSFRQTNRHETAVRSIEDVKYENGQLQFAIAVDLNGVPVDSTYLTNPSNYSPHGFNVESIKRIDRDKKLPKEITDRDWLTINNAPTVSHIITVSIADKSSLHDLNLELSNQIPQWVADNSSVDDVNIKNQLTQTFGIWYLIKGVKEAYETKYPTQKSYISFSVPISKEKTGGSPLTTIFIWLAVVGVLIFVILILLKRRNQN